MLPFSTARRIRIPRSALTKVARSRVVFSICESMIDEINGEAMLGSTGRGRGVRGRERGGRGVRRGDETWQSIVTRPMNCPKQESSNDCAIFVLRYVYNIITEQYMFFNQVDISKERLILAMRILSHPQNLYQRTRIT